ncbi:MAG: hypothetical protein ACK5CY_12785 [Bacteroidia bacterium]
MRQPLSIVLLIILWGKAQAQHINAVLDPFYYTATVEKIERGQLPYHTAVKPYLLSDIKTHVHPDSIWETRLPQTKLFTSKLGRKLFAEHLITLEKPDYQVYIDPLFSFDIGSDQRSAQRTSVNSRGLQIQGSLGKKFAFYTSFWENQSVFVNYVDSFIRKNNVVPGQGRVKPFKETGFDYAYASGYVSWSPSQFFNIQAGNDKQFIGDGYRSLLLSDNAFNYPYAKISTSFWKLRYTNLFMAWQNIGNAANSGVGGYRQKYATIHHLSYNTLPWLNIGLFEGIVWQGGDTTGMRRGFDPNYLNPIIFYRPVEFSRGSPDNVIMGLNLKINILKRVVLYGQLVLDEFSLNEVRAGKGWWANKQGAQAGLRMYKLLGIEGLSFQSELNAVRPYTYGHFTAEQSYTHYAQPMAHPLGANFVENVNFLNYRYRRLGIGAKVLYAIYGADSLPADGTTSNVGQNIFKGTAEIVGGPTEVPSIYGNTLLQGKRHSVLFTDLTVNYLINPKTGTRFEFTVSRRNEVITGRNLNTLWVFFSLRTFLPARYYDF